MLKDFSARGITEDREGHIYINAYGGRYRRSPDGAIKKVNETYDIWLGAFTDHEGNLWFSAQGSKIEKYNPLTGQRWYYRNTVDPPAPSSNQWTIFRDRAGQVWVGADEGLYVLSPETGSYRKFARYNRFGQLEKSTIYHLREEEEGIWIASSSGLYLLEPGKGVTARYATDEPFPHTIPLRSSLAFLPGRNRNLLAGYEGRGTGALRP